MCYCKLFILFVLSLVSSDGDKFDQLPAECGRSRYDKVDREMLDVSYSELGQFPWNVRIGSWDFNTNRTFFFCGGALIHKKVVVTAAHCGERGQIVRVGEIYVNSDKDCDVCDECAPPVQDIKINKVVFADHCRLSMENDLSLVLLDKEVVFNDYVEPVCIPEKPLTIKDLENIPARVSGFGSVYTGFGRVYVENFTRTENLMFVDAQALESERCKTIYSRDLQTNELCVEYKLKGKDPCVADSGSPMVASFLVGGLQRSVLIGVASHFLKTCETKGAGPYVYTNVSEFGEWINVQIKFAKEGKEI